MKPIINENRKDIILTSDITKFHIVVGIINSVPVILSKTNYNDGKYNFLCIDDEFTESNSYRECDTIKEAVEQQIEYDYKIEVFEQKDWKKALQWLIDNAE